MRNYLLIVPVRFTSPQLADIDSRAAKLKICRSALIRESVLSAISTLPVAQRKAAD